MHGLALYVALAAVGIDYGWEPTADGQLEYIIQIEPELLESMRRGEVLRSEIHPDARGVRRFRIQVGRGPLPHTAAPVRGAAPSPPESGQALLTGAAHTQPPHYETRPRDVERWEPPVWPYREHGPAVANAQAPPSPPFGPNAASASAATDQQRILFPRNTQPGGGRAVPELNSPANAFQGAPITGDNGPARADANSLNAAHGSLSDRPIRSPASKTTTGWPAGQGAPIADPQARRVDRGQLGATFGLQPVSGETDLAEVPPAPATEPQTPPGNSGSAGGAKSAPTANLRAPPGSPPAEAARPWRPLLLTSLALFASLGANVYLGWIAIGIYQRYRAVSRQLAAVA